jgi:hypothetical protein
MAKENAEHSDERAADEEAFRAVFENVCARAREVFSRDEGHPPILLVLTRLGLAVANIDMEPTADREPVARLIRQSIINTPMAGSAAHDEPLAVILASEAWMVEYDPKEREEMTLLPPRLHPGRKEVLQVTLRSMTVSFSRNWSIVREPGKVTLGEEKNLTGEGMKSVWDVILTG